MHTKFKGEGALTSIPVSVCIMTKNEENNLPRCLNSLEGFSEIIVLDTGSSDQTLQICKDYKVNLHQSPWVSFSHNRNQLFNLANENWILWLDADEVVRDDLKFSIQEFLKTCPSNVKGAKINRMVYFEGQWIKHGHWFPNWNGRLFKKDTWKMEDKLVHESIVLTSGEWMKLDGILEHYSFKDWEDYHQRSKKYASLWAEQKHLEGKISGSMKAWTHSLWAFVQGYVMKKGFKDGWMGVQIANAIRKEVYRKYDLLKAKNASS